MGDATCSHKHCSMTAVAGCDGLCYLHWSKRNADQQQRTEAVIALAERLFLRHPGQYEEKVLCNYFNDARKFVDAADAYRQQSTEGGADE